MTDAQIKKEVTAKIGQEIGTVWGPCLVQGLVKDDSGNDRIHLAEDGEGFTVGLKDWTEFETS